VAPEGWLYRRKGLTEKPFGYFSDLDIVTEAGQGRLTSDCEVWHITHTANEWRPACKIKAFCEKFDEGKQYLLDEVLAAERKAEEDRRAAVEGHRLAAEAAIKERVERERQREASQQYIRLGNSAVTEAIDLQLEKIERHSRLALTEQEKIRRATHGNGAVFCFAVFLGFGGAAQFTEVPWFGFGAVAFFVLWLFKLTYAIEGTLTGPPK
jgi:hypothetical protein